jgi:hypothetical protein
MDWNSTWAWVRRNWRPLVIVVGVLAVALNAQAVGMMILYLVDRIIAFVALPLLVLALIVWGLLRIMGYGSLWGKKQKS